MIRQFNVSEPEQLERALKKLAPYCGRGKILTITAEPHKKRRSVPQNARYWAILNQISQQMPAILNGEWHSPESYHEYCKRRFLGVYPGPFGEPVPRSTKSLSVVEFIGYCDEIQAHFIDQGVIFDVEEAVSF